MLQPKTLPNTVERMDLMNSTTPFFANSASELAHNQISTYVFRGHADHEGQKEAAELVAQRESWVRAMTTPCEHGVLDFEQCGECRGSANG